MKKLIFAAIFVFILSSCENEIVETIDSKHKIDVKKEMLDGSKRSNINNVNNE